MTHNKGKLATVQARNEPKTESEPSSLTITRKRFQPALRETFDFMKNNQRKVMVLPYILRYVLIMGSLFLKHFIENIPKKLQVKFFFNFQNEKFHVF